MQVGTQGLKTPRDHFSTTPRYCVPAIITGTRDIMLSSERWKIFRLFRYGNCALICCDIWRSSREHCSSLLKTAQLRAKELLIPWHLQSFPCVYLTWEPCYDDGEEKQPPVPRAKIRFFVNNAARCIITRCLQTYQVHHNERYMRLRD